jgi:hypothetical protein
MPNVTLYLPLHGAITPAYVRPTTVRKTSTGASRAATMKKYLNSAFESTDCRYFKTAIAINNANTPAQETRYTVTLTAACHLCNVSIGMKKAVGHKAATNITLTYSITYVLLVKRFFTAVTIKD